jgi:hypothetical protein
MVVGIGAATNRVATAEDIRPNIVLITTDDMTATTSSGCLRPGGCSVSRDSSSLTF